MPVPAQVAEKSVELPLGAAWCPAMCVKRGNRPALRAVWRPSICVKRATGRRLGPLGTQPYVIRELPGAQSHAIRSRLAPSHVRKEGSRPALRAAWHPATYVKRDDRPALPDRHSIGTRCNRPTLAGPLPRRGPAFQAAMERNQGIWAVHAQAANEPELQNDLLPHPKPSSCPSEVKVRTSWPLCPL